MLARRLYRRPGNLVRKNDTTKKKARVRYGGRGSSKVGGNQVQVSRNHRSSINHRKQRSISASYHSRQVSLSSIFSKSINAGPNLFKRRNYGSLVTSLLSLMNRRKHASIRSYWRRYRTRTPVINNSTGSSFASRTICFITRKTRVFTNYSLLQRDSRRRKVSYHITSAGIHISRSYSLVLTVQLRGLCLSLSISLQKK